MIYEFFISSYVFLKENIFTILTAFFLVNGKFVIKVFFRKIVLMSATELGKRYMIERILNHQIKVHFLDHVKDDIAKLLLHIKINFQKFPLVKKTMTLFAFIGSLGFVGKFMGGVLAFKVFLAKVWSFLLAVFLKLFSALFYFITKILWGSWIAPILELILFSWFLKWLEKIPFFKVVVSKLLYLFKYILGWLEIYIAKLMKAPLRRFLKWLVKNTKMAIYKFIGYNRVSYFKYLQNIRAEKPNSYVKLQQKRVKRREKMVLKRSDYISIYKELKLKRKKRKSFSKIDLS